MGMEKKVGMRPHNHPPHDAQRRQKSSDKSVCGRERGDGRPVVGLYRNSNHPTTSIDAGQCPASPPAPHLASRSSLRQGRTARQTLLSMTLPPGPVSFFFFFGFPSSAPLASLAFPCQPGAVVPREPCPSGRDRRAHRERTLSCPMSFFRLSFSRHRKGTVPCLKIGRRQWPRRTGLVLGDGAAKADRPPAGWASQQLGWPSTCGLAIRVYSQQPTGPS